MAQTNPQAPQVKGAIKIGCLIPLLIIGALAFWFFGYPALTPDTMRGDLLATAMAPSKEGNPKLWVLTDGSFNYIMRTETPGRMSIGRECLFCKMRVYVYDPAKEKVITRFDLPLNDIVTVIDMAYGNGKIWIIMGGYGKNDPRIEAYDSESARLVMDTRAFTARHPLLQRGLASVNYNDQNKTISINTRDGLQGVQYNITNGELYRDHAEWRQKNSKDETPASVAVMAKDASGGPRKKLVLVSGPRGKLLDNASSLEHYAASEHSLNFFTGAKGKQLSDRIFLEGTIYHQDNDCAIIIYLDQIGKKANRMMTCFDLAAGRILWTIKPDQLFDKMKIDEESDSFSSFFFTKDHIKVKRSGSLVVLQLKGVGLMGFDYRTGKKLWTMNI